MNGLKRELMVIGLKLTKIKTFLTKKEGFVFIITCLFLALFMYAAVTKLLDYQRFKVQVSQSPLLTIYANEVAFMIPTVEILIAASLFFLRTPLLGLYASYGLMVMFTAYIITILGFAERVPCACGGILQDMNWQQHLVFNIVFVLLGIAGIALQTKITHRSFKT
jgi:hypothetical protein